MPHEGDPTPKRVANNSFSHVTTRLRGGMTLARFLDETTHIPRGFTKMPKALIQSLQHTSNISEVALRQMAKKTDSFADLASGGGNGGGEAGGEGEVAMGPAESTVTNELKVEEDLDFQQHEERLAEVLKLMSGNFALGIRSMIFTLPLVVGLFHDVALLVCSMGTVLILSYFDSLM